MFCFVKKRERERESCKRAERGTKKRALRERKLKRESLRELRESWEGAKGQLRERTERELKEGWETERFKDLIQVDPGQSCSEILYYPTFRVVQRSLTIPESYCHRFNTVQYNTILQYTWFHMISDNSQVTNSRPVLRKRSKRTSTRPTGERSSPTRKVLGRQVTNSRPVLRKRSKRIFSRTTLVLSANVFEQ